MFFVLAVLPLSLMLRVLFPYLPRLTLGNNLGTRFMYSRY